MYPIAYTIPNWDFLLLITHKLLGRSIARGLDSKNIRDRGLAEFIAVLGEFHTEDTEPRAFLRNAGFLLKHASVSMLAQLTTLQLTELLIAGCVAAIDCENQGLVILTASLENWRTTIINLCSHNQTQPMRQVGNQMLEAFDKLGLSILFENYSRRLDQGDLLLVSK